jgi:lysophospholipase L1-like esterase
VNVVRFFLRVNTRNGPPASSTPILRIGAFAVFMAFATMGCDKLGLGNGANPNSPTPIGPLSPGTAVVYTAVGASDAQGIGSSVPCLPFIDCPEGMGYPQIVTRQLKSRGFTVTLSNLGIPTAVIGRDFELLGQQYNRTIVGNFIDQELPFVPRTSTLVTIFAGGNEVNTITAALGGGAGGSDPAGYIDRQVTAFANDYATLVSGLRDRASGARIIALNPPNLAGTPSLASASLAQRQAAQRASVGMAAAVNALASQGVTVVDLMCDSRTYLPSTYSSDGFHPSDAGYTFIANEVLSAATTSTYPPPRSSCPQNTVVPNP